MPLDHPGPPPAPQPPRGRLDAAAEVGVGEDDEETDGAGRGDLPEVGDGPLELVEACEILGRRVRVSERW